MTLPKGLSSGRGNSRLGSAIGKPEAVQTRSNGGLKRSNGLARATPLKQGRGPKPSRGKRKKDPGLIGAWRQEAVERVQAANDGYLVDEATGQLIDGPFQVHHPIEAGDLWTAGLALTVVHGHPMVYHPDNSMVLAVATHQAHHASGPGRVPIPFARLRDETWALVEALDALDDHHGPEYWQIRMREDYS